MTIARAIDRNITREIARSITDLIGGEEGSSPGLTALSYRTKADSSVATITIPATCEEGDFLVLMDFARNNSGNPTTAVPTDFTSLTNQTDTDRRYIMSWKRAVAADAGASVTGMNGNNTNDKLLIVFHGDIEVSTWTPSVANGEATAGDPIAQQVSAGAGSPPLIVIAAYRQSTPTSQSFTPAPDATVNGAASWVARYKIYNSDPVDLSASIDSGDGGASNFMGSFYVEAA